MRRSCGCNKQNGTKKKYISHGKIYKSSQKYGKPLIRNKKKYHKPRYATKYKSVRPNRIRSNREIYEHFNKSVQKQKNSYVSWDSIHKMARDAKTDSKKAEFEKYMNSLIYSFPCPKCRPHIKQYLLSHPIKSCRNTTENGLNIGLSKWSWEFHNSVNKRLTKPVITWEEYLRRYIQN